MLVDSESVLRVDVHYWQVESVPPVSLRCWWEEEEVERELGSAESTMMNLPHWSNRSSWNSTEQQKDDEKEDVE